VRLRFWDIVGGWTGEPGALRVVVLHGAFPVRRYEEGLDGDDLHVIEV